MDLNDEKSPFQSALSNFTFGVANGDLICHLAEEGYSVRRIKEHCDYPVTIEKIRDTVWDYYLETGRIRLDAPSGSETDRKRTKTDYVMDIGQYGKRSFRQVTVEEDNNDSDYVACDFGIVRDTDPKEYQRRLSALDSRQRDYVEGLPWPAQLVYHRDCLQIREILAQWQGR